jgi:hypothetical protein
MSGRRLFLLFGLILVVLAGPWVWSKVNHHYSTDLSMPSSNESMPELSVANPDAPHPLAPVLELARDYLNAFERDVVDYTAKLTKQERINGKLGKPETMTLKVKCAGNDSKGKPVPIHVYVGFEDAKGGTGREVIWVEGRNDGKMSAHEGGWMNLATVQLDPEGTLAMMGSKYPITQIGIAKLLKKLLEKGESDRRRGTCEVVIDENARFDDQPCTLIEVKHSEKKPGFEFHIARIRLDPIRKLPLSYEAYMWPSRPGEEPPLEESYVYRDIKLNVGLTEKDFDTKNEEYSFP